MPGNNTTDYQLFTFSKTEPDELVVGATALGSSQAGYTNGYSIGIQSTDAQGVSVTQIFTITVGTGTTPDPITPVLGLSNLTVAAGAKANTPVGTLTTTAQPGSAAPSQNSYSVVSVSGAGSSGFTVPAGSNQLETTGPLAAGTYTVVVKSSGTFLISDVVDLTGVNGPYAYQLSYDPSQVSSTYLAAAVNAGLVSLASDSTGAWLPAVSSNKELAGSLAQPNYLGPYGKFWTAVTTKNPLATLAKVVGSSGVDQASNTVWAVIDQPGEYAVGVQVFTEQTFTITVGS